MTYRSSVGVVKIIVDHFSKGLLPWGLESAPRGPPKAIPLVVHVLIVSESEADLHKVACMQEATLAIPLAISLAIPYIEIPICFEKQATNRSFSTALPVPFPFLLLLFPFPYTSSSEVQNYV